jgi:hypothetical protein
MKPNKNAVYRSNRGTIAINVVVVIVLALIVIIILSFAFTKRVKVFETAGTCEGRDGFCIYDGSGGDGRNCDSSKNIKIPLTGCKTKTDPNSNVGQCCVPNE